MAELKSTTVYGDLIVKRDFTSNNLYINGNDIADFAPCDSFTEKKIGYVYIIKDGSLQIANKYAQRELVGVSSDNYHLAVGNNRSAIPISIGGFILAHMDKVYKEGTPLTSNKNGKLTKANLFVKVFFPERVLAIFYKKEDRKNWENKEVNGRHWVRIA